MTRVNRSRSHADGSLDLAFQPTADASAARFRADRVTLTLDESTFKDYWVPFPAFNKLVLGSGSDQEGDTGHTYILIFSNRDLALPTPYVIVDGSDLKAGDASGETSFFGDAAIINTTGVTVADFHITTGGSNDSVSSGIGSDTIRTGEGDDFVSIGSGTDTLYTGAGNDYIESTSGDFSAADRVYAGGGIDEISFYSQDVADADFANTRSVEWIGLTAGGDLELGAEAQRVGISKLFVDTTEHAITVTKDFTRTLDIGNSNFFGLVSLDASQSSATILWHAEYNFATTAPTLIGGTGSEDTVFITSGFVFDGAPRYGGDLTNMTGFEHVQVLTGTGDAPAYLILDTKAGEMNAAFLDVDAHTLSYADPLRMNAREATADIHVVAGVGDDRMILGAGDDRIEGGMGADLLAGRGGNDTFVYSTVADSAGEAIDTFKGFRSGHDVIDVTGLGDAAVQDQEIAFFGNQESGRGADRAFAETAGDGVLDAVFRSDTHTLWFDTDDNGRLDDSDLHMVLTGTNTLAGADVLAGEVVI